MSDIGVHAFQIPHEHVEPMRDMIIVRLPMPPRKSKGGIITPDVTRDLMQHNVQAGKLFKKGPIAFHYKDGAGTWRIHDVKIGDWVTFRPFSGTMIQGGTIKVTCGWRYMSTFNDVTGFIPSAVWDPPCEWDYEEDNPPKADFDFRNIREIIR